MFGDYRTDSHNELEDAYDKGRQAYKDSHMREANPISELAELTSDVKNGFTGGTMKSYCSKVGTSNSLDAIAFCDENCTACSPANPERRIVFYR